MIAIKDMEMPKYCWYWNADTRRWTECHIYKSCKHHTSDIEVKPSDCPLVEIITCKDCKHNGTMHCKSFFCDGHQYMSYNHPNFYCGDAEHKGLKMIH